MEEYRSHAHSVSSCKYHFVWCRKYRHQILNAVEDDVRELFDETADHFGHEILALEIADDHVHLFVQTDSKYSPANIARQFKSYSGKHLLERYPEIRESYFWGGGFWKVGYYVGTTGAVSEEVVERYIEETEHAPE
ncbi:IS200-type transposase ISNph6 [Natronomonas pharaonis DSM 2160]|uniref:IS200-type transposase ISNph6 n=1 Tax=Natronomonas pharaonis (strain ATCC 35678 / DSM 2160 / CIP 103997 / JCM 8858 / NBRC 14720 / NCIMB 2260 / Gabara) TaxID=348780 RepID=A0A1U7EXY0_NATPD|nr:IS200/IS605-like element ISNph6 family transposase [Natronomonas pharaonis]CAI50046.1 IS200-type transposase ISNph6 [Natronomonas pharaonis DSM 2160]